ncbi:Dabb family protein [Salmonella enterica subsp. houtenae serovar 44:z36,[z38]:-]|nr:Dabb family protein [Salmonella enterica]EHM8759211.1 Dabb family protein [Salmonella enterica subsp. houtenae serovar 44:z36,[z38]:-]HCM6269229.1 Dabb family protein [Salmonella enterica subsp. houtenae serovar 44:z36,Z38:-]EHL5472042.1 Dabb family protein [Salmonella enterica]EHL5481220.1 Dabb family protein [Salmonella enterica]
MKKMIRHILLMKFDDNTPRKQLSLIQAGFLSIPDVLSGVLSVEWGANNSPEGKNAGFTHCVMMTFMDESTRAEYLCHPEHLALKNIFRTYLTDIIVFDYQFGR